MTAVSLVEAAPPGTAAIVSRRTVRASAEAVAAVLLDWSQDSLWRARVVRMDTDPPGSAVPGQLIVERLRFAGLPFVTPTQIEDAGPLRASFRGGSEVLAVAGAREIVPSAVGQVEIVITLHLRMTGPLVPLAGLLSGRYQRLQDADLDRLARLIEQ